jgi:phospholipid/cholesterol/gamma-HCH transport system permease protein
LTGAPLLCRRKYQKKNYFDPKRVPLYPRLVQESLTSVLRLREKQWLGFKPLSGSLAGNIGRKLFLLFLTVQGICVFAVVILLTFFKKFRSAQRIIRPAIRRETARASTRLMPMLLFLALALGFLIIAQTAAVAATVGATHLIGTVMVVAVVREIGPLLAAFIVLVRVGVANVIELGTIRAMGEIEVLESLGIDPVHFLVVPRVIGMAVGVFSLTVYFILAALASGYLFAFLQGVPLTFGDYFRQIAEAFNWLDFVLLGSKTIAFGFFTAVVTCYHGLAQPLRQEQVSGVAVHAVSQSIIVCVVIDVAFILIFFLS